jgi:hypothetical protein
MIAEQLWRGPRRLQVSSIPTRGAPERSCARVYGPVGPLRDIDAEPTVRADMKAPPLGNEFSGRHSLLGITVARSEISRTRRSPPVRLPWSAAGRRYDLMRTTGTRGFRGFGPTHRALRTGAERAPGVPGACSRQRPCHLIRPPPPQGPAESAPGLSALIPSAAGDVREPPGLHLTRVSQRCGRPPKVRAYPLPQRSSRNQEGLEPC